jgi:hypothetical protein
MNCDEVFQHMTSARPSPQNGAIERHLHQCDACRQMADLFKPAIDLLGHEAGDEADLSEPSRGHWSRVLSCASEAERAAKHLEQCSGRTSTRRWQLPALMRMAAVMLGGILIGILCTQASISLTENRAQAVPLSSTGDVADAHECRYEDLIAEQIQSRPAQFCADCRPKLAAELSSVVAVCMVCHIQPAREQNEPYAHTRGLF